MTIFELEHIFNCTGLICISESCDQNASYILGQILAEYPPFSHFYCSDMYDAVRRVICKELVSLHELNIKLLDPDIAIANNADMRLFMMGWASVRGYQFNQREQKDLDILTKIKLDFGQVKVYE